MNIIENLKYIECNSNLDLAIQVIIGKDWDKMPHLVLLPFLPKANKNSSQNTFNNLIRFKDKKFLFIDLEYQNHYLLDIIIVGAGIDSIQLIIPKK